MQFLDEPIFVEAHLVNEALYPQRIVWRETPYVVISVGRQWRDEDSTHILVELETGGRMDVAVNGAFKWRVCRYWPPVYQV